jgi:hypothetical protein
MACIPDPACYSVTSGHYIQINVTDLEHGQPPNHPDSNHNLEESPAKGIKHWLHKLGKYLAVNVLKKEDGMSH